MNTIKDKVYKGNQVPIQRILVRDNKILGYEKYFNKLVTIAYIDKDANEVRPTHGYFAPHPYGKKVKNWSKRNGYVFNNN